MESHTQMYLRVCVYMYNLLYVAKTILSILFMLLYIHVCRCLILKNAYTLLQGTCEICQTRFCIGLCVTQFMMELIL